MTWYRTGTIALTNGNATVTGSGTAWIANASIGEGLIAPDGRIYEITGITSDTALTISPAYLGSTASAQSYAIAPLRGRIAQLLSETSSLLASFANVRDGIGAGLFPDGTVSAPALRFSADQDTGIFRPAANVLGLVTDGAQRVTVDASGNVGVGTASPDYKLDIAAHAIASGVSGGIRVGAETDQFSLRLISATTGLGVPYAEVNGPLDANGWLAFNTGNPSTERLRITAAGNVGIGTTTPSSFGGYTSVTVNNATNGGLIESTTGGGTRVLRMQSQASGSALVGTTTSHPLGLMTGGIERITVDTSGIIRPGADNTQSLGEASFRWSGVFAGTGTINTSDEREKVWRGDLSEAELRAAKRIIGELGIYQWADAIEEKGGDARLHFGVRAQQAFAILEDEGLEWWRYAWCCYDQWDAITEPVLEDVIVQKTRTVIREQIDEQTGETSMVEIEESYEETEQRETGEVRIVREAGDRYGIRPDQLAFWLIAAQAAFQSDLEARLVALEAAL